MQKTCRITGKPFEITSADSKFYNRMGVPEPTICPEERARRRMAWGNQLNLYHTTCRATGKKIITNYAPDKPYAVYDLEYYHSDKWDARDYGREFDFSRPFFEQFNDLILATPKQALLKNFLQDENSDYSNYAGRNKNCYMIFDSDFNRDCFYSYSANSSVNVVDSFRTDKCELCYECIDCVNCYDSSFLQNSENCSESFFLKNCIGCKNCFGSVNLRNKEYYFLNQKCSKEEYEQKVKNLGLNSHTKRKNLRNHFLEHAKKFPHKFMQGTQNEDVSGNYLVNCKNAFNCFDSRNLWDCAYIQQAFDTLKDSQDCTEVGTDAEMNYECCYSGEQMVNNRFCSHAFPMNSDCDYCFYIHHSKNCFGCTSLNRGEYCILNKQYTKEEYFNLKAKIIEHMKKTGEWGEFFPISMSPFGYNESIAQDYFPLEKPVGTITNRPNFKYNWYDGLDLTRKGTPTNYTIPDEIESVQDDILKQVLTCETCSKNYKIVGQELQFYRQIKSPIPRNCFHCRHDERQKMRNPRNFFTRICDNPTCKDKLQLISTFSPERPEKVFCEKCYLDIVD